MYIYISVYLYTCTHIALSFMCTQPCPEIVVRFCVKAVNSKLEQPRCAGVFMCLIHTNSQLCHPSHRPHQVVGAAGEGARMCVWVGRWGCLPLRSNRCLQTRTSADKFSRTSIFHKLMRTLLQLSQERK